MSQLDPPQHLFGLPYRMSRGFVAALSEDLVSRFEAQHGRPPAEPGEDLQLMREKLFDPVSREERLRRELDSIKDELSFAPPEGTPETLVLAIGEGAFIITPEGRLAIPVLKRALVAVEGEIAIDELDISAVEHLLSTTYREWVRYRLNKVVSLRSGEGRAMLPAAIGTVLFLLVNGNIGVEAALGQPRKADEQRRLDDAVTAPIEAFVREIEPSRRGSGADRRHLRLYNGYGLSEARRRMGQDIVLEREPGEAESKRLYIAEGAEERVISALGREMRAREVDRDRALGALEAFLEVYEEERPRIAAFGVSNARPSRTKRFREALLKAI